MSSTNGVQHAARRRHEEQQGQQRRGAGVCSQRAMITRRKDMAVQIRRRRKEETLQRRRGLQQLAPSSSDNPTIGTQQQQQQQGAEQSTAVLSDQQLMNLVDRFLQRTTTPDSIPPSSIISQLQISLASANPFLLRLVEEDPDKAHALVAYLLHCLQQATTTGNGNGGSRSNVLLLPMLQVVLQLSSCLRDQIRQQGEVNYYGHVPGTWVDLLVADAPDHSSSTNLVSMLVQLLSIQHDGDTVITIRRLVAHILGNLFLESSRAVVDGMKYWSVLVGQLPITAFPCAAILKKDSTTYGMSFLQHLTPPVLAQLLASDSTVADAMWIYENLSHREEAAINLLCQDRALMTALVNRIHQNATVLSAAPATQPTQQQQQQRLNILVPALRTISNLAVACDGRYVKDLLSHQELVAALNALLEERICQAAVMAAASLLVDAGTPHHPATTVAIPRLLPSLLSTLTSEHATLEWKREAAVAVNIAIGDPPHVSGLSRDGDAPPQQEHFLETIHLQHSVRSAEAHILHEYVWRPELREDLVRSLIDLLRRPDIDAVVAALGIADRLLRLLPACRNVFEMHAGMMESLEFVCDQAVGVSSDDLHWAADKAAALLDDFFHQDIGDDDIIDNTLAPEQANNQFVFGAPQPRESGFDFSTPAPPVQHHVGAGRGRGRGMTIPSWMQQ